MSSPALVDERDDDIPEPVIVAAVHHWAALADSPADDLSDRDCPRRQACQQWRQQHPQHEQAWQRLMSLQQDFSALPQSQRTLAKSTLIDNSMPRRQALKMLALVGLGLSAGGFAWQRSLQPQYLAARGKIERYPLPGNSMLSLNAGSRVDKIYDQAGAEKLQLQAGDIFVDSRWQNTATQIQLGEDLVTLPANSSSRVWLSHSDERISQVMVDSGAALIQGRNSELEILPGQILQKSWQRPLNATGLSSGQPMWQPVVLDHNPLGWLQGQLIARGMPLQSLLDYLNRYHYAYLQLEPALAQQRVSGVYPLMDLNTSLYALSRSLPIDVNNFGDLWYRISAA